MRFWKSLKDRGSLRVEVVLYVGSGWRKFSERRGLCSGKRILKDEMMKIFSENQ